MCDKHFFSVVDEVLCIWLYLFFMYLFSKNYTFLSLVKCTLHFLAMLVSLKLNRFVSFKLKSCLVLKLLNTPVSYLFLLLLGTVFISLSLNSAVTRWYSLPIYAPYFIIIWSIWVFSFPQGDTHVSLCIFVWV